MGVDLKALHMRYERLKEERAPWLATWKSLGEYFLPTGCRCADDSEAHRRKPLLNPEICDSTGLYAIRTLAAGMQGGMTSPARPWFSLQIHGLDAGESADAQCRAWLGEVTERMRAMLHVSNFYGVMYEAYRQLAAFGTACVYEEGGVEGLHFDCCQAGTFVLDVNSRGSVDTVMRRLWVTARQAAQEFGEEALPRNMRDALKNREFGQKRFPLYHAVYPRSETPARRSTARGTRRPFASVYWTGGNGAFHLLRESGFASFPFFGVRWSVASGDVYGTSPAMDSLPDCRMLQQMAKSLLHGIHKNVNPPMLVDADALSTALDMRPGGITYVSRTNGAAVTPAISVQPDVQAAQSAMNEVRRQIREGLYNDLFRMLTDSDRRQITASEIDARESEKLILIGPVLERLHDELFIPLIDRTFELMQEANMLPEVPERLRGRRLKVEFVSTLAQAQKLVSTGSIRDMLGFAAEAARLDPSAADALNADAALDKYGEYLGLDANLLRPRAERDALREERARTQARLNAAAEERNAIAAAGSAAQTAKTLSHTPVGGGTSALNALLGGLGRY